MNSYTSQFHSAQFPGHRPQITGISISKDFWHHQNMPFVDIDGQLDVGKDLSYLQNHHQELFTEMDSQVNRRLCAERENRVWYSTSHGDGWEQCIVVKSDNEEHRAIVTGTDHPDMVFASQPHTYILTDILDQLRSLGFGIRRLMVAALAPGGWIQPHTDPKKSNIPVLSHFWIPVSDSSAGLKIWPYGYLQSQVGHIYLFNNQNYVHSVINTDQHTRYVLLGLIDTDKTSHEFLETAVQSARNQWC